MAYLDQYQITDAGPRRGQVAEAEELRLDGTKITDEGLKEVAKLENLKGYP